MFWHLHAKMIKQVKQTHKPIKQICFIQFQRFNDDNGQNFIFAVLVLLIFSTKKTLC